MHLEKLSSPRLRRLLITVFDVMVIALSLATAFWLRFDSQLDGFQLPLLLGALTIGIPVKMAVFAAGGLQQGSWRYASLMDLVRIFFVNVAASSVSMMGILFWVGPQFPRSAYVGDFFLCFLFSAAGRFCYRV